MAPDAFLRGRPFHEAHKGFLLTEVESTGAAIPEVPMNQIGTAMASSGSRTLFVPRSRTVDTL